MIFSTYGLLHGQLGEHPHQVLQYLIIILDNSLLLIHHHQEFKKLNTFNLPDSSIVNGSEHFEVKIDTGANNKNYC